NTSNKGETKLITENSDNRIYDNMRRSPRILNANQYNRTVKNDNKDKNAQLVTEKKKIYPKRNKDHNNNHNNDKRISASTIKDKKNNNNTTNHVKISKNEEKKASIRSRSSVLAKRKSDSLFKGSEEHQPNGKRTKMGTNHISDTNNYDRNNNNSNNNRSGPNKQVTTEKTNRNSNESRGKNKEFSEEEVTKLISRYSITVVEENSCEYQDGIIYESIVINKVQYSICDDVMIFYANKDEKKKNTKSYILKKGKISGFYKNLTSKNLQVEICLYYDMYDDIYIKELEKIQKSRRSKGYFEEFLDEKTRDIYLLGNVEFKIVDANLIFKKVHVYNEKNFFEKALLSNQGKDKFLCTHYLKEREDKLCEIQNEDHWDNLVLGSSDLYYYFSNNKKSSTKNKSLKLIIDKLKINEMFELGENKKGGTPKKSSTTTHAKTRYYESKIDSKAKTTTHTNGKKKDLSADFKNLIKQDQENYYINLLSNIKDPTDKAIRMMQLDVVPKYLPCREKEIKEVHEFLESGIKQEGSNQILYISGMPGTGKTATVYSVIQLLQNKSKQKYLPPFNVFEINGMNVVHPNAAYQVFYKQLFNKKPPNALNSFKIIDRLFNRNQKDNRNVSILIIDEIDYLITKTQKVLFTLFDWPTKVNSKLVLIAISNTMDLPERLIPRCRSRLAFGRLVFSPYKGDEIEKIIKERLENCKEIIDHTAIQLCARKVANVSGDIRKALQICRKAFENKRGQKIVPRDITEATNQLFDSPLTHAINYLPWAFKTFLTCIIIELRMLNEFIIPYKKVVNRYKVMIETSGKYIGMCSDNELFKIMLDKLVKMGILLIRPYIPLENLNKNKSKESLLGFNESSKKTAENKSSKTQVNAEIDKESGDMGLELNVETQLIITALMKDSECSKKLNFY
ncbi:origin recognition complex subunit 1, putative, partial [Plasmodium malariae]